MTENKRGMKQLREGVVVQDVLSRASMKTVTVEIERFVKHLQYKKYIRRFKRFLVHDERNECRMGDRVEIMLTSPISKHKRWKVTKVVGKAQ